MIGLTPKAAMKQMMPPTTTPRTVQLSKGLAQNQLRNQPHGFLKKETFSCSPPPIKGDCETAIAAAAPAMIRDAAPRLQTKDAGGDA